MIGYPRRTCAGKKEKVNTFIEPTNLSPRAATAVFRGPLNIFLNTCQISNHIFCQIQYFDLILSQAKNIGFIYLIYLFFSHPTSNSPENLPSLDLNYMLSPILFIGTATRLPPHSKPLPSLVRIITITSLLNMFSACTLTLENRFSTEHPEQSFQTQ